MPKIKVKGQTVQTGQRPQTNGRTHKHTHRRYQTCYLPCCAVDNDMFNAVCVVVLFIYYYYFFIYFFIFFVKLSSVSADIFNLSVLQNIRLELFCLQLLHCTAVFCK